jgi:hypothetical protein
MFEALFRLIFEAALWQEKRRQAKAEKVKAGERSLREELEAAEKRKREAS